MCGWYSKKFFKLHVSGLKTQLKFLIDNNQTRIKLKKINILENNLKALIISFFNSLNNIFDLLEMIAFWML